NPDHARKLVLSLSTFFRKNLKRSHDVVTLSDEIEHVNAYLEIEKARFADRLSVEISLPDELMEARLPAFSLQPVVENAIKHGISQMFSNGRITLHGKLDDHILVLEVEDNAGLYQPRPNGDGLGMNLVDRRIKVRYGSEYGVTVINKAEEFTRIIIKLPFITASES
ncbi:sensor histidine kinase, partial [Yersinia enterocolitica]